TDPDIGSTISAPTGFAGYALNESAMLGTTRIATSASTGVALGPVSDSATLLNEAGNGTLNFKVYSDPACTALVGQSYIAGDGDAIYNRGGIAAGPPGSYSWVVTYAGTDPKDSPASQCGAAGETSVVGKATPALAGKVPAHARAHQKVTAAATVSDGANPSG